MFTCGGRVSANMMQSATSSACSGPPSADVRVDGRRLLLVALEADLREVRLDQPRRDVRDPHRLALQVVTQRTRVAVHRELRGDVRRAVRVRPDAGHGAEVDNMPAAVDEVRDAETRHPHQAEHVRLDHLALVLLVRFPDRVPAAGEPGVVDQDVQAAELLERALDEPLAGGGVGDVEGAVAARPGHDPRAGVDERLRRRGADPARTAGHDRALALQVGHGRNLAVRARAGPRQRFRLPGV